MRVLPPVPRLTGLSGDAVFRAAASLALAFLLWAWVTTQRDPPETRVFADLTLQAPTLPEPLQIAGELPSVTIEVIAPRSVVDRVRFEDQTRRIDNIEPAVSEVTVSGPQRLVDNVARVVLPVDIGERTDDFTVDFVPTALDAAG